MLAAEVWAKPTWVYIYIDIYIDRVRARERVFAMMTYPLIPHTICKDPRWSRRYVCMQFQHILLVISEVFIRKHTKYICTCLRTYIFVYTQQTMDIKHRVKKERYPEID